MTDHRNAERRLAIRAQSTTAAGPDRNTAPPRRCNGTGAAQPAAGGRAERRLLAVNEEWW